METKVTEHKVSVIVPIYKVEKYLRNCLDSLLNQTYPYWEAILVDDGSPDNCGKICDEYAAKDSRFKVIHKENGGLSSARNAALPHISGEYIFFLDSDDFLHYQALAKLMKLACEFNADIVQCDFIRGSDAIFPQYDLNETYHKFDNKSIFTSFAARIITWCKLYRRAIISDIKFPEGLINEDDFTTWKFYYNAKVIIITAMPLYYYTINPNSIMANKTKKPNFKYFDAYRERIQFFQEKGESDLEAVSRIQWMKSLVMSYSNPMLSNEQRNELITAYKTNYKALQKLPFKTPIKLDVIFKSFRLMPYITSQIVNKLYSLR